MTLRVRLCRTLCYALRHIDYVLAAIYAAPALRTAPMTLLTTLRVAYAAFELACLLRISCAAFLLLLVF